MNYWIFGFLIMLYVQVGTCSKCNGEHQYKAADGSCQQCEMCQAGYEPTPYHCGYGERDSLYSCKPCDHDTYSLTTDYNFCRTCNPCKRWNAVTTLECTKTSNSLCGACHPGYFRPQKADGRSDIECHKCKGKNSDPSCQTTNWLLIAVILSAICLFLLTLAIILSCKLFKSRKNSENSSPKIRRREPTPIIPCNTSVSTSCEILSPSPSTNLKSLSHNRTDDLLIDLGETYSTRPTAQFEQSSNLYPQLPTAQFHSNQSAGARTTRTSCYGSVDQLRRNIDTFDTNSLNNPTASIINHDSLP